MTSINETTVTMSAIPSKSVESENNKTLVWNFLNKFYQKHSLLRHQHESYAHYIQHIIPDTILETVPFEHDSDNYSFSYKFTNAYLHKPGVIENDGKVTELTPAECRLRSLTYSSPLFIEVNKTFTNKTTGESKKTEEMMYIGMIPTMVKSIQCGLFNASEDELIAAKECIYDKGGYFIVNGTEKILVGMERMSSNQVYVFPNKHEPDDICAEVSSLEERAKKPPSLLYVRMIPCSSLGKKSIRASSSHFKKEFPLGVLLRAYGYTGDIKELLYNEYLFTKLSPMKRKEINNLMDSIVEESYYVRDSEDAFEYLESLCTTQGSNDEKKDMYIHAVLQKEILPHVGIDIHSYEKKITFIYYMVQKLFQTYYKLRDYDDHDHSKNKRTDESGILVGNIFKQAWAKLTRELQLVVKRKMESSTNLKNITLAQLVNNTGITKDITYPIATGNWSVTRNSKMKTGVSQLYNRFNGIAALSHARRNINPMPKNSVLSKPRQLHNSSWGTKCVTGDTEVTTRNGVKQMRDITEDDEVQTVNKDTLRISYSKIVTPFNFIPDVLVRVETITGETIKCTRDHPFLVERNMYTQYREWVLAENLEMGDVLVVVRHGSIGNTLVRSVTRVEPQRVYDFTTVNNDHSFVANHIVVHNCPFESPEGPSIGLITNKALSTHITIPFSDIFVQDLIHSFKVSRKSMIDEQHQWLVLINGKIIEWHENNTIYNFLRSLKLKGSLPVDIGILINESNKEIQIFTDSGRTARPLLVVEDNKIKLTEKHIRMIDNGDMTVDDLFNEGIIEMVDSGEQETLLVAIKYEHLQNTRLKYTHAELSDALLVGVSVSTIAYANSNPSARIVYQAGMAKQAVSVPRTNFKHVTETSMHVLNYPQRPLCQTDPMNIMHMNDMPTGQNAVVAILNYGLTF